ncbi:hypothetical protein DXG01_011288 [Tephrocybe rancida]|nr:hypothetical protein DXG01_011288 [Tephrocybe rancida]
MPASHDVYFNQLNVLRRGFPLYHPDPPQGRSPIEIGDVGFTRDGGFIRLFSASKLPDDPVNQRYGVPEGFEVLDLGDIQTYENELEYGPLHCHSVKTVTASLGTPGSVLPVEASFQFSCTSKQGAVLVLETSMKKETAVQRRRFEAYLRRHCRSWHEFAHQNDIDLAFGDLMLVTECSKTAAWSSWVYWDSAGSFCVSFSPGNIDVAGFRIGAGSQRVGPMERRRSQKRPCDPHQKDQTVFVKACRLGWRGLWPHSVAHIFLRSRDSNGGESKRVEQSSNSNDQSSDLLPPPESSIGTGGWRGLWTHSVARIFLRSRDSNGSESKRVEQSSNSNDQSSDLLPPPESSIGTGASLSNSSSAVLLEAQQDSPDFNLTSVLLGLELEASGADCAIVHDDEWCIPTPEVSQITEEYTKFYFEKLPLIMMDGEDTSQPPVNDSRDLESLTFVPQLEPDRTDEQSFIVQAQEPRQKEDKRSTITAHKESTWASKFEKVVAGQKPSSGEQLNSSFPDIILQLESIFSDKIRCKRLTDCNAWEAQLLLDSFQHLLDTTDLRSSFRKDLIIATQRLSSKAELAPASYRLQDVTQVGENHVAFGDVARINKGQFQGQVVCLKTLFDYGTLWGRRDDRTPKHIWKEAILWGQLSNPNIVEIYGIYIHKSRVSLVAPWMENEDIDKYLKKTPDAPRVRLAMDVASGLMYLHDNDIIHGDLKKENVLVDGTGRARLNSFDQSQVLGASIATWEDYVSAPGSMRTEWAAPEVVLTLTETSAPWKSKEVDVYSWGHVAWEIITDEFLFLDGILGDVGHGKRVVASARRPRPDRSNRAWKEFGMTGAIWACIDQCLERESSKRPSATTLVRNLKANIATPDPRPSPQADELSPSEFRRAMTRGFEMITEDELKRITT